jgi:hypothetical protein
MKNLIALLISGALVVSGHSQTRNVLVGTNNAVVQPTNFWSADASNARTGLGLGTAATNPATAFQPSSSVLTNLASSNAVNLTNLRATNIVGTVAISNGGTGATNNGLARTNLGLGWPALTNTDATNFRNAIELGATWLTNTNVTNFRTAIGLGATNDVVFNQLVGADVGVDNLTVEGAIYFTETLTNLAVTRTNLGLPWSGLTNTNAATFQAALFGSNTNPVLVNTNGEVVSPTNFWAVAPISTTVQYQTNVTGTSTNAATNSRNLFLFSLSPSVSGITNTVTLPTNPATTFEGDRATIIHLAQTTNAVTAIGQLGAATNLITLNQLDETVLLMYRSGAWRLADNISYIEPIYFSGTNAAENAAASRTNLGLGLPALTNTNVTNFRSAIGLGETNSVTFSALTLSSDLNFGGGDNIVLSTTNGTKIGTETNQLLGFYNQTPIVQPSSTGVTTNGFTQGSGNNVHPNSTFTGGIGTNAYTISDIVAHLKSLGLLAP